MGRGGGEGRRAGGGGGEERVGWDSWAAQTSRVAVRPVLPTFLPRLFQNQKARDFTAAIVQDRTVFDGDLRPFLETLVIENYSTFLRITFCTVELCLSKCCPRLTITPVVLRRVTVSPAQSLSTWTSKCALLHSCGGYCCAFLGTPFKYLATHVTSSWFRLDRFRDVCTILR